MSNILNSEGNIHATMATDGSIAANLAIGSLGTPLSEEQEANLAKIPVIEDKVEVVEGKVTTLETKVNNLPTGGGTVDLAGLKNLNALVPYGRVKATTDCNDLPVNSVYMVALNCINAPFEGATGAILTIGGETTPNSSGVSQIFIASKTTTSGYKMFARLNWAKVWGPWYEVGPGTEQDAGYYGSFALFETVGVVGDSYATGACGDEESDTTADDHVSLSWPQQIARRNGIEVTNYSVGGLSTRTFLTHQTAGLPKLVSDPARGLYILALIRNDYNIERRGETAYCGTITDITNNSLGSYPDTFYGNYATIIESIANHAPDAKIVLMTGDYRSTDATGEKYNNAMIEIATHYGLPIMIQNDDGFFASDYYRKNWAAGSHPSAIIYSGMATAIERLFSRCLSTYKTYFTYYKGVNQS